MKMDILGTICSSGKVGATHIMYDCNLSYVPLNLGLEELMDARLINCERSDSRRAVYSLTEKGVEVLEHFRQIRLALEKPKT